MADDDDILAYIENELTGGNTGNAASTVEPVVLPPVVAQLVAKQPPAKQPPAKQPPAKQPPAKQPPAKQPPAKQPLAKQPPTKQPVVQPSTAVYEEDQYDMRVYPGDPQDEPQDDQDAQDAQYDEPQDAQYDEPQDAQYDELQDEQYEEDQDDQGAQDAQYEDDQNEQGTQGEPQYEEDDQNDQDEQGTQGAQYEDDQGAQDAQDFPEYPTYDQQPSPTEVVERMWGMFMGCVLGGAVGVQTSKVSKETLAERYREHEIDYPLPANAPNRGVYPINDWPFEIDQLVLMMRSFWDSDGEPKHPIVRFASGLSNWLKMGFPELGDNEGVGCDQIIQLMAEDREFPDDPIRISRETRGIKTSASPIIRTLCLVLLPDSEKITTSFCQATHNDSRAVASSVFATKMLGLLVLGYIPSPELIRQPAQDATKYIGDPHMKKEMIHHLTEKDPLKLDLGGRDQPNHIFKTLSAIMWSYRAVLRELAKKNRGEDHLYVDELFKATIREIAMEGGNTTMNCAMAGAVMGATFGFKSLPRDWLDGLPNRDWLYGEIDRFFAALKIT